MDFLKYGWDEEKIAHVSLIVKKYPEKGVTLEELKPSVEDIRANSTAMFITADLVDVDLLPVNRLKQIAATVRDVIEYTKDDTLLKQIKILNVGFIFRFVTKIIAPSHFRHMIIFA